MGGSWFEANPEQKVSNTPSQISWVWQHMFMVPAMGGGTGPSYGGGTGPSYRGGMAMGETGLLSEAGPSKITKSYLKNNQK
jgi:hypothetical protein